MAVREQLDGLLRIMEHATSAEQRALILDQGKKLVGDSKGRWAVPELPGYHQDVQGKWEKLQAAADRMAITAGDRLRS